MKKFDQLLKYGQSYWLDNLSREILRNDELKNKIENEGLRGVTSNPIIFRDAITNGNFYDTQISELAQQGKNTNEIYEALVVQDIQDACDLFLRVYDSSDGQDGFVSLEVSPFLARNTEATINEARKLFRMVNRPNCMIKIPGTAEGIPAIEQMLYEGININTTLLFSVKSYQIVAESYIKALERRDNDGKPIDRVASVASFFLSRIDVLTDQVLENDIIPHAEDDEQILATNLLGESAVASARIAYNNFEKIFSGDLWGKLTSKGASVQRLLWASTSNKTEGYRDTRYVDPLIGPYTVNTMPPKTIQAFKDHGKLRENTIREDVQKAMTVFIDLEKIGIRMDEITDQLVNEGIKKFVEPFDELLKVIEEHSKQNTSH